MTYDELLAKIEKSEADMCSLTVMDDDKCEPIHEIYNALRAVVKLSKPRGYKNEVDEMYIKGWNAAMSKVIQAIERELQ